ncbi:DapH/DapD/GlmU-related protein [Cocleimonas sp. KMM 6892]|uniref:acyltransferase n=1 Tax=unclassified Cocleimonas TaxID=2639732 RepID=UPI002DBC81F1|nr:MULTISPECIES: DapH/DapD/GlmU-related protein [unclassified Cocleimonas]MEB8430937.1 DapH/DapD/GlmU-related protein [Cocleimonas sp. KMM 6892]MEC4714291.1 DapH/DapD/GlmU-related protein [Cocleimonas sp. KMM 6895]MEC4743622.1 DapH/DapD/GlmU-related protein [Cocleimonas sp. KMM 6896]
MLKKYIKKTRFHLHFALIKKTGIGTTFLNFTIQRIFKNNSNFKEALHFTSTVIGRKLDYNKDLNTLVSFSASHSLYLQSLNGIKLGENILIAPGVKIISSNHNFEENRGTVPAPPIEIGNNVWLGANSIILPGVKIANNCVIGAGSVVTKSIKIPGSVVAGNPAKILKYIQTDD